VADAAAAPVIAKYTRGLAAADVFTAKHDVLGHGVAPPRPRFGRGSIREREVEVLVTGATGKQGGHLVRELLERADTRFAH